MSKVAIIQCDSYDSVKVKEAVEKGLNLIGGIGQFVEEGEKILLKPNMLAADAPERCSTTNPAVFRAVAELFIEAGGKVSYGDSPAFHAPLTAAKKAGIAEVADELNIPLANFQEGENIFYEAGLQNKKFYLAKAIGENDGVISLPKLKTHGLARMTGCIKNQFGCIPGPLKGEMHVKLPNPIDFSKMLVDLNHCVNPRLYVMDGILAMEGNGPRGGTPRAMNVLLISSDPVALDATVCRIVDLDPEFVPTTYYGMEVGMGTYKADEIEILGASLEDVKKTDFDVVRVPLKGSNDASGPANSIVGKFGKMLNKAVVPKPVIQSDKCVKCGVCVLMCPVNPKAVNWSKKDGQEVKSEPPVYDYNRCIKCYCCQELCPESAISIKVPFLRKVFGSRSVNS